MPKIYLSTRSAVSRAPQLNAQRLVNIFTEHQPPEAKSPDPLFGAPGLLPFSTAGNAATRGSWLFGGIAYFVQGTELYSVSRTGTAAQVGAGIAGSGPCGMSDNGVQMCIVNGEQGYIYTVADGLVQITDDAFYPAKTVTFMDGYFIFDRLGTNQWFISGLYDGLAYDGTDFASAEAQPGFVTAAIQNLQLLFIFCTGHIEIWYDAGTADFPFQRYAGGVINFGCISPYAIIKQDGAIFFLGADHVIYRLQNNEPQRISTHPMEHIIQNVPDISLATAQTYTIEGHKMVAFTFPDAGKTIEYDISTTEWHERESWQTQENGGIYSLGQWRAASALAAYDTLLVGDAFSGQIGAIDWSTYSEYGNTIPALIVSSHQHSDRQRLFCSRFELDIQAGVGLANGQGANPQVMLRYSRDGGMTWSLQQQPRAMGKIGEYRRRLRWLKQGMGFQFTWELLITDPVFRTIISAHADIEAGM